MHLSYLRRVGERMREEGILKTLEYGALVGADTLRTLAQETYMDLRYGGRLLYGNETSAFKHLGAHDVYHTDYAVMPLIFDQADIGPADVLVDVGCGKGRVINYWLSRHPDNRIIGLELDPALAAAAAERFAARTNVEIKAGDAVDNLPAEGTVFYFYNPFAADRVAAFERRLRELGGDGPVRVVYYNPQSVEIFDNPHWSIRRVDFARDLGVKRRGRLNKFHELAVITPRSQS